MFTSPTAHRALRSLVAAMVVVAALVSSNTAEQTVEPASPPDTSEVLPVDAAAFAVTGEESEPLAVTFSNGDKTVNCENTDPAGQA